MEVLMRWGKFGHPLWIADAAFGSMAMLEEVTKWDGTATLSCASGNQSWLWTTLSFNLPPGHWRAAYHQQTATINLFLEAWSPVLDEYLFFYLF